MHVDLRDLIVGLATIIMIALVSGQFDKLEAFALKQGEAALKPWPSHPFFPKGYEIKVSHRGQ